VTLHDGDVAALAERAVALAGAAAEVRIEPDPGNDPYRWGRHFWLVHFRSADGRTATARVGAEDTEEGAGERLSAAAASLAAGEPGG
jgi:hypothetical protein